MAHTRYWSMLIEAFAIKLLELTQPSGVCVHLH